MLPAFTLFTTIGFPGNRSISTSCLQHHVFWSEHLVTPLRSIVAYWIKFSYSSVVWLTLIPPPTFGAPGASKLKILVEEKGSFLNNY
jgi:hypothetical protein